MAEQAEGTDVVEVALSSTLGDGQNVIGVPKAAAAGDGLHAVEPEACCAGGAAGSPESRVCGNGVDLAGGATSAVAGEDLIAKVTGVRTEAPLMDAIVAAEGAAALRKDLKIAPAA
jgi:hypothetical protein